MDTQAILVLPQGMDVSRLSQCGCLRMLQARMQQDACSALVVEGVCRVDPHAGSGAGRANASFEQETSLGAWC